MANGQGRQAGEPHERKGQSVAHDAHDALAAHRPPHGEANDPNTPHGGGGSIALHGHPSDMEYVRIAAILTAITAVEVAIYYIEKVGDILVPALILLSVAKFAIVVGYFMHLKFDDRRFTWIFSFGLVVALSVFLGTAAMFLYHTYDLAELARQGFGEG